MAAAVLGNLALLPDSSVPSRKRDPSAAVASTASADRRRPEAAAPRNPNRFLSCSLSAGGDVSRPPTPPPPLHRRRRGRLGPAATSPSSSSGGDDDWEKELRNRLKELEEMKELEKRAEELQSRRAAIEAEGEKDESEEEKRERVRRELEKLAKEQAQRRETAKLMFELGQKAYGKGMYARAIEFLEAALTIIPRPTFFGGEIQIWLAMAYEANNRHRDCIALYQQLEKKHPSVSIRRQAAELRYILQAPKLKISKDEMVTIPLIGSSYDRYAGTWTGKYKDRDQRRKTGSTADQLPPSRDFFGDFMLWRPPVGLEKSPAFWVVVALWAGLLGTAVLLQR
ncbi:RNA exonuclease 1 [Apostasia shenzhenica]|uniref:RNA exonuclease 1 n=1 Tax=Apostasia shenzhenica TaxID=1088818 RepID=A0A2I0AMA5_9ASPA|nr:RNA exonuclease 1 [Apostasia shenzhenica]